jgi:hypothetical protein
VAKKLILIPAAIAVMIASGTCGAVCAADSRQPTGAVASQADAAERDEISGLVRELGAPTYRARQHAQRMLAAFGLKAKPALEAACHDPDHEIQKRAKAALAAIDDVDFHVRVGAFLADENAANGHGLAGWDDYRALVGTSAAARRLFADMQRSERELLEAVDRSPSHAGGLVDLRCQQSEAATHGGDSDRQSPLSLGTIAAIFFAASHPDVPISVPSGNSINGFGSQTAFTQAMTTRPTAPIVRGLVGAWVSRAFEPDSITGARNLIMAMQYNLKEALIPALRAIGPPGGPPNLEQYAILAVGKLGSRQHVAALMPLLDDERPIAMPDRSGRDSDTQVRDVALAAMIHLTGQKLADYGFVHAKTNPLILFNSNTLGFNDPAARQEALKKWRAWWDEPPK